MRFTRNLLLTILILTTSLCKGQFYFDFEESNSFYKKKTLLKSLGYQKEHIIVKQRKDKALEDSFRIIVINYNNLGQQISTYIGSKWNPIGIKDTTEYSSYGRQTTTSYFDIPVNTIGHTQNLGRQYDLSDTIDKGNIRYEFDSINKVKKVFYKKHGTKETLTKLIFYDIQGRVTKVDYSPESEIVYYAEYHYKNNKLKIYTVSKNGMSCNERIIFNDMGQVVRREVDFTKGGQWNTNIYYFTYTGDNLLKTEKKNSDGKSYTEIIHYYEK